MITHGFVSDDVFKKVAELVAQDGDRRFSTSEGERATRDGGGDQSAPQGPHELGGEAGGLLAQTAVHGGRLLHP